MSEGIQLVRPGVTVLNSGSLTYGLTAATILSV